MKKAGIFAAVIAAVLLFMQFYNYKLWGYTDDVMYVIDGEQAARYLKDGLEEGEDRRLPLKRYDASTPLYTRGDSYFAGEGYEPLDLSYPVYVNEGSFLYSFSDSMDLISSEFEVLNAYDGLYMAEGHSYNRDRQLADPEEFVFLSTPAGFYMNLQDMVIHSQARDKKISANSLLSLEEGRAAFLQFDDGAYIYEDSSDLMDARVTIGSVHLSYEELLEALGKLRSEETEKPENRPQETETESEPESANETEAPAADGLPEIEASQETTEADLNEGLEEPAEDEKEGLQDSSDSERKEQQKETEEYIPEHPPIPKDSNSWDYPNSGEEGDADSEEDSEDGSGGGNGSSQGGSGSDSGSGDSSQGPSGDGDSSFVMPEASLSPFEFGVYDAAASLSVSDPSHAIIKGVRLIFYEKDASRASYRKLYPASGTVTVEPLKPDTEYDVEGYFDYEHPQYGKQREVFAERTYCGKTRPVSELTPLAVSQKPGREVYAGGILIEELTVKSEGNDETATPSQADGNRTLLQKSTASYISSVQMEFDKAASPDWSSPEAVLGSSQLAALKKGEPVDWKTADILDSNSRYHYRIRFYDRFGNELPLNDPSDAEGDARTSKQAPEAAIRVSRDSNVNRLEVQINIDNPDQAAFLELQGDSYPSFFITTAENPDAPIRFTIEGEKEALSRYPLKKNAQKLVITSLLPGTSYTLWVRGSYDLEDNRIYENQVMGSALTTTDALSSLGTVNFSIDASKISHNSALITARMRSAVSQALYPYISEIDMVLEKQKEEVFSFAMRKDELEKITIGPEQRSYTLRTGTEGNPYEPEITVTIPDTVQETVSVWDAILTTGEIRAWYKEGNLSSASDYKAVFRAKAVRGDSNGTIEEDVTGRYYSAGFKTLRQPVYVSYDMSFINGSTATFYDFRVNDPDGAVAGGKLTMRVRMATNNKVVAIYSYTVEQLAQMSELIFDGLEENTEYILDVIALEYNEGYSNSSKELQKELYLEDRSPISFKTVNSLYGSLTVESMKNGYEEQKPEDGIGVESANLLDINDSVLYKAAGSSGLSDNGGNMASGYIKVEQGSVYYLGGGINTNVVEYDQNRDYIGNIDRGGIYMPSQNAAYIRVNVSLGNMAGGYVSRMLYAEPDSKADLSRRTSVKQGFYLEEKIAPTGDKSVSEKENAKAAVTDFISFDPLKPLIRLYASPDESSWVSRNYRAVFFYDRDQNYLGSVDIRNLGGTIATSSYPKGAAYVRLNLSAESEKDLFLGQPSDSVYGKNLLSGNQVIWHDGMYVTWNNRYSDKGMNKHLKYSDYIKVKPSTVYELRNGAEAVQVFDSKKNFQGYLEISNGYMRMPEDAAYVRVNANFKEDNSQTPVLRQASPSFDQTAVTVGFHVRLEDRDKYLGDKPVFTLEYEKTDSQGQVSRWEKEYQVASQDRMFSALEYLEDQEPNCHFTITQTVELGGHRIVLDTLSFDTSKTYNIISSEAGLKMANYANMDDYIVTGDIEVTRSSSIRFFYGKLDFGGHTVKMKDQRTLIQYLYEDAEVTNLVADISSGDALISQAGLLVYVNRGSINNTVLRMSVDNQKENNWIGGIARTNYGTIDRFAVELTGKFYVRNGAGAVTAENYGQITNGYVVSQEGNSMIVDKDAAKDAERYYRGGIAGNNINGRIENVYSVLVIEDHYGDKKPSGTDVAGLVAGKTSGEVNNAFGVGMVMENNIPLKTNGPVLGSVSGKTSQISYVETQSFSEEHYNNIYNNQVTVSSLWDKNWMDQAINGSGAFTTAVAADGYYPQVNMSASMEGKQPLYRLPALYTGSYPKVISVQVLEHTDDTARIKVGFENKNRWLIKSMDIAVMNMDSNNQRVFESAAKAQVESQGAEEDGNYYAVVSISEPSKFRSKYYINGFVAGLEGTDSADQQVEIADREKTEMILDFYQPITSLDQWKQAFDSKNIDRYGNYRLRADRFDFGNLSASDLKKGYRITGTGNLAFYGSIDGGWVDEQGQSHMVTLEHLNLNEAPFMIQEMKGSLRNIKIRDMRIDTEETLTGNYNIGFIGTATGAELDHIYVEDSEIHGWRYSGAIVSQLFEGSVMTNCYVKDTVLVNYAPAQNLSSRIGGLAGTVSGSAIRNCFAQNLEIDSTRAVDMEGTGGIAGLADGSNSEISNCYATGEIRTGYRYSGGIAGYFNSTGGTVKGCYGKVNIDTYSNFSGGILGYLNAYESVTGNLSVGDLFIHSTSAEGVHRIAGYAPVSILSGNYGYAGQMYNSQVSSEDGDDGDGVFSSQDMMAEATYTERLKWKDSYAYSWENGGKDQSVADGYLPFLRGTDGMLLPGQTLVPLGTGSMRAEIQNFALNNGYDKEYQEMFGSSWPADMPQPYVLQFNLYYDREQYDIVDTYMEGMELNGYMGVDHKQTYTMTWSSGTGETDGHYVVRYPFVTQNLGGDIYCLKVVLQSKADPDIRVTISAAKGPTGGISIEIGSAKQWNDVMSKYGNTYGNFILTNDIDANDTNGELVFNVNINRLSGKGKTYTIKNVEHTVTNFRENLISSCLSGISNVRFENIKWQVPEDQQSSSYSYTGLIGINQGTISNVEFDRVSIRSGTGYYTGCIAYNTGNLENIHLTDIKVESNGSYVGGLAGYSMKNQPASQIKAEGVLSEKDGTYSSSYEVSGVTKVGGMMGEGAVNYSSKADGIVVSGKGKNPGNIGGIVGYGDIPEAGSTAEEKKERATTASDMVVQIKEGDWDTTGNMPVYVGGLSGQGTIYYAGAQNVCVKNPEGRYAGGISGGGGVRYSRVSSDKEGAKIPKTSIIAKTEAGGVIGNGSGTYMEADTIKVEALEQAAGGIVGTSSSTLSWCSVDRARIHAPVGAGGIAGEVLNQIDTSFVSRCEITASAYNAGGLAGQTKTSAVNLISNGVISSTIRAEEGNTETEEGNAGGLLGYAAYMGQCSANYTKDVTVSTKGDYAGGLLGYSAGGTYERCYTNAAVEGRYGVGGFIGGLEASQRQVDSSYKDMKMYHSYSYASLKSKGNAGGFVGTVTPGAGNVYPSSDNVYGLLSMVQMEVLEGGAWDFFLNMEDPNLTWKGNALRIYEEASVNGKKAKEMDDWKDAAAQWDTWKPKDAGGTGEDGNEALSQILLVTSENLKDKRMYVNTFEKGGMGWSASWRTDGLGRMDAAPDSSSIPNSTLVQVTVTTDKGTDKTDLNKDQEWPQYKIDADDWNSVSVKMEAEGAVYEWFRLYIPSNTVNNVNSTGRFTTEIKARETPLAGRGYYIGQVKYEDGKEGYTPILIMDSPAYMPYINSGSNMAKGAQEGYKGTIDPGVDSKDELAFYDGTDRLYYGGIRIPEGSAADAGGTLLSMEEAFVQVFPSGAASVNLDLGADYAQYDHVRVADGDQVICDTDQIKRVYTLDYDYSHTLSVTLRSGEETGTFTYDPTLLRRTVMVWGDEYYYLCGDRVMNSQGTVLDTPAVHLYGGKALGADGRIYDLEGGSGEDFSPAAWTPKRGEVPLWQTEYEGMTLKTMGSFTELALGEESNVSSIREQQLLVKNGKLYGMTGSTLFKGFVVDDYNGLVFASFLDEKGRLKDSGDRLKTPEDFDRTGIAHMSVSAGGTKPYVLVRYATGLAKGFNYVTGEELAVENEISDVSFLDFAADFAGEFFGGNLETDKEFADLKKLESQLTLAPVTDGQLADALAALNQTEEPEGQEADEGEKKDDPAAASSDYLEQTPDENGAYGSNKGEKTGKTGPSEDKKASEEKTVSEGGKESSGNPGENSREAGASLAGEREAHAETESIGDRTDPGEKMAAEPTKEEGQAEGETLKAAGSQSDETVSSETAAQSETEPLEKASEWEKESVSSEADGQLKTEASEEKNTQPQAEASKAGSDPSETEEAKEKAKEPAVPDAGTVTYVYSFHADKGKAVLYSQSDLLHKNEQELMNEEEKLELLQSAGIVTQDYVTPEKSQDAESGKGILLIVAAVGSALGLSLFLIHKKRKF